MGAFERRHALIFAAAPETEYGYIRAFLKEHPDALIACADGGLRHARALGRLLLRESAPLAEVSKVQGKAARDVALDGMWVGSRHAHNMCGHMRWHHNL